jgi:nitroreductase
MTIETARQTSRAPDHPAERVFVDRWSPRGFAPDEIPLSVLRTFFEAARWAPSAYNSQPWRFVYALRGEAEFETFLAPLIEFNRGWARHASALVYLLSKKDFTPPGRLEPVFARTHSFDAGAAWANFANQAALSGWAAHGMSGIDAEAAHKTLGAPDNFTVEIAIAVGRKGDGASLPPALLAREKPSSRAAVDDFVAHRLFTDRLELPR